MAGKIQIFSSMKEFGNLEKIITIKNIITNSECYTKNPDVINKFKNLNEICNEL